jgi:GNAT superfamily N-acetyltransferase
MRLGYLVDCAHHAPALARWHHDQFAYLDPDSSVEKHAAMLERTLTRGEIPTTFVALEGDVLLGSSSLVRRDMSIRPELAPWLAAVYVTPARRGKGVGTALVHRAVIEAQRLGVENVYLYTPDKEQFYARRGWSVLERVEYRGWDVVIMEIDPTEIVA